MCFLIYFKLKKSNLSSLLTEKDKQAPQPHAPITIITTPVVPLFLCGSSNSTISLVIYIALPLFLHLHLSLLFVHFALGKTISSEFSHSWTIHHWYT